jgi:hypothetical protein
VSGSGLPSVTERHYCRCGATLAVTSDRTVVNDVVAAFWAIHDSGPHGVATRREASKARRRHFELNRPAREGAA